MYFSCAIENLFYYIQIIQELYWNYVKKKSSPILYRFNVKNFSNLPKIAIALRKN